VLSVIMLFIIIGDEDDECAEQSVLVLAGESPAWAKVNHQPNT